MKKLIILGLLLTAIISIGIISCKKSSDNTTPKTTGHLKVVVKFPKNYHQFECDADTTKPINVNVDIKTLSDGQIVKTLQGNNNSTFDFGELLPNNYKVEASGIYVITPNSNCFSLSNYFESTIQIVANQDQTITLDH